MTRSYMSRSFALALWGLVAAMLGSCGGSSSCPPPVEPPPDPGLVTPASVGVTWMTSDTREGGAVDFVSGDDVAPLLGEGCLELTTTDSTGGGSSAAKVQLFTYAYASEGAPDAGTRLDEITRLGYWAFRDAGSTNPAAQTISLNIEVDFTGDGTSFTTLVFEPIYNLYQQPLVAGVWQYWDAFDGGNAIWWSSKDIPGVCAFSCFVTWDTILAANPDARILGGLGFNCGSGWAGDFRGLADGLTVGVNGTDLTYDFEP